MPAVAERTPDVVEHTPADWLNRKQASAYLHSLGCPVSPGTLARMAVRNNEGKGPPFTVTGWKMVRYARSDLRSWAKSASRVVR